MLDGMVGFGDEGGFTRGRNASPELREVRLSPREIAQIAADAGVTPSAIYARIKAGDTGNRLRRERENRGRHRQMVVLKVVPRVAERPATRPIAVIPPPPPPVGWSELESRARAIGIPRAILYARVDAGWPEDRLLDPVRRWRRPKRIAAR